jgi:hypothetical protein
LHRAGSAYALCAVVPSWSYRHSEPWTNSRGRGGVHASDVQMATGPPKWLGSELNHRFYGNPSAKLALRRRAYYLPMQAMTGTGPTTMFTYAKPSTIVRAKIMALDIVQLQQPGHSRSTPRGVDTPAPGPRVKPWTAGEQPVDMGTSGVSGRPATEPESGANLAPVSRL